MDKYLNYADLKRNEVEGEDYIIRYRVAGSAIAVMAPHGGGIEPGTIDLADRIAGDDFLYYSFSGIKKRGNSILHINSTMFDEPLALEIAGKADTVLTLHGCSDKGETVFTGGRDRALRHALSEELTDAGFNVEKNIENSLKGESDHNLCNRCRSGKGIQLEISMGLRQKMFCRNNCFSAETGTEIFYRFVSSVRKLLLSVHK